MQGYRHFFWDFDGTLYDTYQRMLNALTKSMEELGIGQSPVDIRLLSEMTLRQACILLAGEERADALYARFFVHAEEEGAESMRPFPGCEEALRWVMDRGGVNYLYTHRNFTALDALKRDGLIGLFHDFITYEAGFPDKPAPDALRFMTSQHGLNPSECVMIGDRLIDVQAGHNAGMAGVLFDPLGYFPNVSADYRFTKLTDITRELI